MYEIKYDQLDEVNGGVIPVAIIGGMKLLSFWGGVAGIGAFGLSKLP